MYGTAVNPNKPSRSVAFEALEDPCLTIDSNGEDIDTTSTNDLDGDGKITATGQSPQEKA